MLLQEQALSNLPEIRKKQSQSLVILGELLRAAVATCTKPSISNSVPLHHNRNYNIDLSNEIGILKLHAK